MTRPASRSRMYNVGFGDAFLLRVPRPTDRRARSSSTAAPTTRARGRGRSATSSSRSSRTSRDEDGVAAHRRRRRHAPAPGPRLRLRERALGAGRGRRGLDALDRASDRSGGSPDPGEAEQGRAPATRGVPRPRRRPVSRPARREPADEREGNGDAAPRLPREPGAAVPVRAESRAARARVPARTFECTSSGRRRTRR